MTIDDLKRHISAVVDYNWQDEYADAVENGAAGHIILHLIRLAEFIGNPLSDDEKAELFSDLPEFSEYR